MEAAIAAARQTGNKRLEGNGLCNLGVLYQVQGRFEMAQQSGCASLAIARDLGTVRLESIVLCNIGMACDSLGRYDEARRHYEGAVALARQLGDRRQEGQFLGYLGLSHARQSQFDDARNCLSTGEEYLRASSDPISLAILISARAETECLAGAPDTAREALAEAEEIARKTGAGADSELGLAIARARGLLERSGMD
jgi:tetratricopeptide (TPR) repeat protein